MVHSFRKLALALALAVSVLGPARAEETIESPRIALVIGNGAYRTAPLPTAANDAGLVAQTLAAAGFDVTGARDLDGASLRRAIHDFLDKASAGGPRGIAVVYLAGHALQVDGENVFAPTDADLSRSPLTAIDTLRIADLTHALAATTLGAKVVVVDGAHADMRTAAPFAGGLALVEPEQGLLLAFNAAPGTLAPIEPGPYGTYAKILSQTIEQGGVPVDEMFERLRVAVNGATGGAIVPWSVSRLLQSFTFFDRGANAPALGSAQVPFTSLRSRPLRDFSAEQAYDVALARDTLASYQDYLTIFPDHPLARRIRAILAARREAAFWRDAVKANVPPAYWTYLRRYPNGPHGAEAQRRLVRLAASMVAPPGFAPLAFDVAPPPEDEIVFFDRHGFFMPADLPPPPPPPLFLLPPPSPNDGPRQPSGPPPGPRLLPVPPTRAIPYVRPILPPGTMTPPRGVAGRYLQPRPFAAASGDGGLVPRGAPEAPGGDIRQPVVPAPAMPIVPVAPVVEPAQPRAALPPKVPALPSVPPTPLPASPPNVPKGVLGHAPQKASAAPVSPVAPLPASPASAPTTAQDHALPKPTAPAPATPSAAAPVPVAHPGTAPRVKLKPHHPPTPASGTAAPAIPDPGTPAMPSSPTRQPPAHAPPSQPAPAAPPITPQRPAAPPRPAVPPRTAPAAEPTHSPQARATPGGAASHPAPEVHRPARLECGQPGQPLCHP